jgi:hypothetical protein
MFGRRGVEEREGVEWILEDSKGVVVGRVAVTLGGKMFSTIALHRLGSALTTGLVPLVTGRSPLVSFFCSGLLDREAAALLRDA